MTDKTAKSQSDLLDAIIEVATANQEEEKVLSGQIKGLFDANGNIITPEGWSDEGDAEAPQVLSPEEKALLEEEFVEDVATDQDAASTVETAPDGQDINHESDEIFDDIAPKIPDPDAGEISHADFIAQGYSMSDLLRQQAKALSNMTENEIAAHVQRESQRMGANADNGNEQESSYQYRPGVAAAIGYMMGATISAVGEIAKSGGTAISRQVGEFSHRKAKQELSQAIGDASGMIATMSGKASKEVAGVSDAGERKKKLEEFFNRPENNVDVVALMESFQRAESAAAKIIKRGAKLGNDPEQTIEESVGIMARFKNQHKDALESMKYGGISLASRLDDSVRSLFDAAKSMFASIMARFGIGGSNNRTGASPGMR